MSRDAFRNFIAENHTQLPRPVVPDALPLPQTPQTMLYTGQYDQAQGTPQGNAGMDDPIPLPDFERACDIVPGQIELPGVLVEGLLHRGCKLVLAGGSKSYKSWSLIDLGLAVATGGKWWGLTCNPGRVLYVNFELINGFFNQRLLTMCSARGIQPPENFLHWGLRSKCYDLRTLAMVLKARASHIGKIDLLIIDPVYKALGDLDENSAGDMSKLMQSVEKLSDSTGAAVAFGAHFSKGNQSGKESIDRISGSGVFARDPDAILTMTKHKDSGSYVVDSELRYLQQMPPFVVTWEFPRMRLDEGKDPRELWEPGVPKQTKEPEAPTFTEKDILNLLPHSGLQDPAWRTLVVREYGKAGQPFYNYKKSLLESGKVVKRGLLYYRANLELTSD